MQKKQLKLPAFLFGWGLLAFFLWQINFSTVLENLQQIGWQFGWMLLITGLAYWLAATAWYHCFTEAPNGVSIFKLFVIRQIGETLTTINPANIIVGESAKAYLLKKINVPYEAGIASILLSRLLIMLSMVVLFLLLPVVFWQSDLLQLNQTSLFIGVGFLLLLVGLFFYSLISSKLYLFKFFQWLQQRYNITFLQKINPKIKNTNEQVAHFYQTQKWKMVLAFGLSFFHWIMGALEFYVLLTLLNVPTSIFTAILIEVGVTCVKSIGAFIPGQIGIEEYGNKVMLELLQLGSGGLWVTISILRRIRQIFWLILGGLFFLLVKKMVHPNTVSSTIKINTSS